MNKTPFPKTIRAWSLGLLALLGGLGDAARGSAQSVPAGAPPEEARRAASRPSEREAVPRPAPGSPEAAPPAESGERELALSLLEEELNSDPKAAAKKYAEVVENFDRQRETAAHAVFRLGECYRKLGRTEEARAQYGRILREFVDFPELAKLSQKQLALEPSSGKGVTRSRAADGLADPELIREELKLLEEELAEIEGQIKVGVQSPSSAIPLKREILQLKQKLPRAATGLAAIRAKLERIIIPKLEFRDATLREAVEFLKKKSVELDTEEKDPSRKGINIVLKLDPPAERAPASPPIPGAETAPAPPIPNRSPDNARLTVSLAQIPLMEALRYVTALADVKFKVDEHAVSIVPLSSVTDVLITKEYKVPPGFIGPPLGSSDTGIPARANAKEFLLASGVTFPPGATATYFPVSNRLILRNTQENLEILDTLMSMATMGDILQLSRELNDVEAQLAQQRSESERARAGLEMVASSPDPETFSQRMLPDTRYAELKTAYERALLHASATDGGKAVEEARTRIRKWIEAIYVPELQTALEYSKAHILSLESRKADLQKRASIAEDESRRVKHPGSP